MEENFSLTCEFAGRGSDVFSPGGTVEGCIELQIFRHFEIQCITVTLVGKAQTSWESDFQQRILNGDGITKEVTPIVCYDEVTYVNISDVVWAQNPENRSMFGVGRHRLFFSFPLPNRCPPSFEGEFGSVRYSVTAKVDDKESPRFYFTVLPRADLSRWNPLGTNVTGSVGTKRTCFCLPFRSVILRCRLSKFGYVPGEQLVTDVELENRSKKLIESIKIILVQTTHFLSIRDEKHSTTLERKERKRPITIAETKVNVDRGGFHQSAVSMVVPPLVPTFGESIVGIDYHVKVVVTMETTWRRRTYSSKLPVFIGTLPIVSSEGEEEASPKYKVDYKRTITSMNTLPPVFEPLYPYYTDLPSTPDVAWLL
ncbi:unnamed protein product [Caenorhabditis auriculariae]|uniref:Arrestin C-terminal-like domain-containing protein n=1 Tax=Caenorhabditis auriculariae TaxID=2777116 RepID=A0A8S1HGR9_9PELO|nr:unnamed protein product [Caenorhabditis auriculariae]